MDLHRTGSKPDWLNVPVPKRNTWQRLAAKTKGVVTPGNILTIAGFILVLTGLWRLQYSDFVAGFGLVATGRLFDLLDGIVASRTGTKSPLGESLDAGFDKLASIAALGALYTAHIISAPIVLLILIPNVTNALVTVYARHKHAKLHPSRYGKNAMASAWVGIGLLVLAAANLYDDRYLIGIGYIAVGLSFALGIISTIEYYLRDVRSAKSARP